MQNINFESQKIKILIPSDEEFKLYKKELRTLYKNNQDKIRDTNSFDFVYKNTLFYAFISNKELVGAIYYFVDEGKLFLNGFSKRKSFVLNLFFLQLSLSWFNCPIYAEAQNRASALCLLRCGFKRLKSNLFVYKHSSHISSLFGNVTLQS